MTIRRQIFANNAKTTLSLPIVASDTTITVSDGSKFPSPTTEEYFSLTLDTGSIIEIVEVTNRSGNTLTVIRARENTVASNFPSGTTAENRVTADTLSTFAKMDTRMSELASINLLTSPQTSNGTSYVCNSLDDGGNPTIAIKNTATTWRFTNYPRKVFTGTVAVSPSPTLSSVTSTVAPTTVNSVIAGKYLIQFTTGNNAGVVREISTQVGSAFNWSTALGVLPIAGDQFEIYKSANSIITELESASSNAIIYSILLGE